MDMTVTDRSKQPGSYDGGLAPAGVHHQMSLSGVSHGHPASLGSQPPPPQPDVCDKWHLYLPYEEANPEHRRQPLPPPPHLYSHTDAVTGSHPSTQDAQHPQYPNYQLTNGATPLVPELHTPKLYTSSTYNSGSYFHSQPRDSYGQQQQQGERRIARAQQACEPCRGKKTRCDEGRPSCGHCIENTLKCSYNKPEPAKKWTEKIEKIEKVLAQVQDCQERQGQYLKRHSEQLEILLSPESEQVPRKVARTLIAQKSPGLQEHRSATDMEPCYASSSFSSAHQEDKEGDEIVANVKKPLVEDDKGLSISIKHNSSAHKLLRWPLIRKILDGKYDDGYVMAGEKKRGSIQVYGQGEGDDTGYFATEPESPVTESLNQQVDNDLSSTLQGTVLTPYDGMGAPKCPRAPNMDANTIHRFHESYVSNMHLLHPFLDLTSLDTMITAFIHNSKRSTARTIEDATVLLVLALGSICEYILPGSNRDIIPDSHPTSSTPQSGLYPATSDHEVSLSAHPSPENKAFSAIPRDNRTSLGRFYSLEEYHESPDPPLKDISVIPGIACYAYATHILDNLRGRSALLHIHACLLAGLYAGQLAHPLASHGWVCQASTTWQILFPIQEYRKLADGTYKESVNIAYWTCLQLESDLLAELDLPASGISRLESDIEFPKGIHSPNSTMMFYHSAQIYLRKTLNFVHTDLYEAENSEDPRLRWGFWKSLSTNFELWRKTLPKNMLWEDTDPPSEYINTARMRAKYYGASYITNRPLLQHALLQATAFKKMDPKVQEACRICVDSAIRSTTAFDGIKGKLIVTNIFGTAHAQFGNLLVLSATYMSNLSKLVDRDQLRYLLRRTIAFLSKSKYISPTLRNDAEILENIYRKIFDDNSSLSSS
ncbi:hypothetical protein FQN54_001127 [Arachnomyces sp. PD_36]|nr:hypothetical protein FQN54_001127 [Arachnomyces sp. PD_36]